MIPDELRDMLAPIRLPPEFATFGPRDALAAFLIGILISMALRRLLGPLLVRTDTPAAAARRRIAALSRSPERERVYGLAELLHRLDPNREQARPEGLDAALYDPRGTVDPALLERAILDAARRRGRRT